MSESDGQPKKRLILTKQPSVPIVAAPSPPPIDPVRGYASVQPDVNGLLGDALQILDYEISNFKRKSRTGKGLNLSEARVLNNYIKSLTDMSRELRERDNAADVSKLTDEEILKLMLAVESKAKKINGGSADD